MSERNISKKSFVFSLTLAAGGSLFGACGDPEGNNVNDFEDFKAQQTAVVQPIPIHLESATSTLDNGKILCEDETEMNEDFLYAQVGDKPPDLCLKLGSGDVKTIDEISAGKPLIITFHTVIADIAFDLENERRMNAQVGESAEILAVGILNTDLTNFDEFPIAESSIIFYNNYARQSPRYFILDSKRNIYFTGHSVEPMQAVMLARIVGNAEKNEISSADLWGLPFNPTEEYVPAVIRPVSEDINIQREYLDYVYFKEFDLAVDSGVMKQAQAIELSELLTEANDNYLANYNEGDPITYLSKLFEVGRKLVSYECQNPTGILDDSIRKWATKTHSLVLDAVASERLDLRYWLENRNVFDHDC